MLFITNIQRKKEIAMHWPCAFLGLQHSSSWEAPLSTGEVEPLSAPETFTKYIYIQYTQELRGMSDKNYLCKKEILRLCACVSVRTHTCTWILQILQNITYTSQQVKKISPVLQTIGCITTVMLLFFNFLTEILGQTIFVINITCISFSTMKKQTNKLWKLWLWKTISKVKQQLVLVSIRESSFNPLHSSFSLWKIALEQPYQLTRHNISRTISLSRVQLMIQLCRVNHFLVSLSVTHTSIQTQNTMVTKF